MEAVVTSAVPEEAAEVNAISAPLQPGTGDGGDITAPIEDTDSNIPTSNQDTDKTPKRKAGRPKKIPTKRGRYIRKPKGLLLQLYL